MEEKILGIDLGTNSIGWAIRDLSKSEYQIPHAGVLTFEKGVGEGKSGEFPKVQKRTESRHKRRNYQAEKYRKQDLLKALIAHGMCPLTIEELRDWSHYRKGIGRKYPQSEKFINWLRYDFDADGKPDHERMGFDKSENHYLYRWLAVSEDPAHRALFAAEPQLLGRVLYHIVQRRGFRGRDEEEAKTMIEGSKKNDTKGRMEIDSLMEKHGTLGAALYHLQKNDPKERIRKRYNLRTDVAAELVELCRVNGIIEGTDLYKSIMNIVWQRPLRSQKGNIGICTFEKGKPRCATSHPVYEEFRTWVFINNLRIHVPEGINRLEFLTQKIYPVFIKSRNQFEVSEFYKPLQKVGAEIKAKFKPHDKAPSATFLKHLKEIMGDDWKEKYGWEDILLNKPKDKSLPYNVEDIWHVLATFDSKEKVKQFAIEKLKLEEEKAEDLAKIKLQQGYATLSLSAIRKLLPYLKMGILYPDAVYLANLPKIIGKQPDATMIGTVVTGIKQVMKDYSRAKEQASIVNGLMGDHKDGLHSFDPNHKLDDYDRSNIELKIRDTIGSDSWENRRTEEERSNLIKFVSELYQDFLRSNSPFVKTPRKHDMIKEFLIDKYAVDAAKLDKYLWHPSEQESYEAAKQNLEDGNFYLGDPQPLSRGFKNPMALKSLQYLKKLINYLIKVGKIDSQTRIVVEIARELNDANKRAAIDKWQRDREKENIGYSEKIKEIADEYPHLNLDPNKKELIDKYRLWVEQKGQCLYTGKMINSKELFEGTKYDLEHTIPASMSFDNELKNLTIADSHYNRDIKGSKIPTELPNYYKDATIDGVTYTAILPRLDYIEKRKNELEDLVADWRHKTKYASTKEIKDAIIQKRHYYQMELEYWAKKWDTFSITEYKAGWRNSQLRDTQTITKYALPYLKTVFDKVEVQKGSVTDDFRKIFSIQPRLEKKNRDKHSHHAIDAAVLTLIPPAVMRDKILKKYNEANDLNQAYHEKPSYWKNFHVQKILDIENTLLVNYQAEDRMLSPAVKNVRVRGRIQYVKTKLPNGKWEYKLDAQGNRIPKVAKGDGIRGSLHKESFFGAIKDPESGEIIMVERCQLTSFTDIKDCNNIVDSTVRKVVENELNRRLEEGKKENKTFKDIIGEPIPFGKTHIKKVRCKVATGRGYLSKEKAMEIRKHDFVSRHEYKQHLYAQNDGNALCLFYSNQKNGADRVTAFRLVGLMELANLRLHKTENIKQISPYDKMLMPAKKDKEPIELPLVAIIQAGHRVIFYKENPGELKDLPNKDLIKRLYKVRNFNDMGTPQIYLDYHLEARKEGVDEHTKLDTNVYQGKLKMKASQFTCAMEGLDFTISLDGTIEWVLHFLK